jgi:hypothetical protein
MEAIEFVAFAGKIVTMGRAGARSAVSRAYYGTFHIARDLLHELIGEFPGSGRSHNLVPQYLFSANHPPGNAAATLLSSLHRSRILADYDLANGSVEDTQVVKLQVEMAVEAHRLLGEFRRDALSNPAVLDSLRAGIKSEVSARDVTRPGRPNHGVWTSNQKNSSSTSNRQPGTAGSASATSPRRKACGSVGFAAR